MEFKDRLRMLREEKGLNQKECVRELGVEYANYNKWENGKAPNYDTLSKLAKYFNVTTDYLLGLSNCKNPQNESLVSELGLSEENINLIKNGLRSLDLGYPPNDKRSLTDILNMVLNVSDGVTFIQFLSFIRLATFKLAQKGNGYAWGNQEPVFIHNKQEAEQKGYVKMAHDKLDEIIENIKILSNNE